MRSRKVSQCPGVAPC